VRPLADDYCVAANLQSYGYLGNIVYYLTNWSGDLSLILTLTLFLGTPINLLGFSGYAVAVYIFLIGSISLLIYQLFSSLKLTFSQYIFLGTSFASLIFLQFQLSAILEGTYFQKNYETAHMFNFALNSWSTVILQYLVMPTIYYSMFYRYILFGNGNIFHALAIAICIGTSGYVFALSIFLLWLFSLKNTLTNTKLLFGAFLVIAALTSYFSSGAEKRSDAIISEASFPSGSNEILHFSARQLLRLIGLYINPGILFLGIIVFISIRFLPLQYLKRSFLKKLIFELTGLIFVGFLTNMIAEYLTYPAFWHLIFIKMIVSLQVILAMFYFGKSEKLIFKPDRAFLIVFPILLALILSININQKIQRASDWAVGSAPLTGIADRESDWVNNCWKILETNL
jgi:hypothetical protein